MKRRHEVLKHFIDAFQTTFRIIYVPPPFAKIDLKLFYITRKFDKHTLDNLKNSKRKDLQKYNDGYWWSLIRILLECFGRLSNIEDDQPFQSL